MTPIGRHSRPSTRNVGSVVIFLGSPSRSGAASWTSLHVRLAQWSLRKLVSDSIVRGAVGLRRCTVVHSLLFVLPNMLNVFLESDRFLAEYEKIQRLNSRLFTSAVGVLEGHSG